MKLFRYIQLFCVAMALSASAFSAETTYIAKKLGDRGEVAKHWMNIGEATVKRVAGEYCTSKKLGAPSIAKTKIGCPPPCETEYERYDFVCSATTEWSATDVGAKPQTELGTSSVGDKARTEMNLKALGEKCADIGFKKGSKDFGNCVLKLLEIDTRQSEVLKTSEREDANRRAAEAARAREQADIERTRQAAAREREQALAERARAQAAADDARREANDNRARELAAAQRAREVADEGRARARSNEGYDYERAQGAVDAYMRNSTVPWGSAPAQLPPRSTTTNCRRVGQQVVCTTQ